MRGRPARARAGAGAAPAARAGAARRRRLGDRVGVAGAARHAPRPARPDVPDQGDAAGGRADRGPQGRRRARDDRRPRAQRPRTRLRAGLGALAGAARRAGARRRHAPRVDGRGDAAARRGARRAARRRLPRRVGDRRAEDRGARPDRRARAGRPRRVDGGARARLAERRPRAGADDPDVRDRGGARAPLGRRRHRLGFAPRRRDRGVVGEGAAAARGAGAAGAVVKLLAVVVDGRGRVDPDEPVFGAGDEALLRGRAAFETARVYGGRPFRLDAHLDRLAASAAALGLPAPDAGVAERLAHEALAAAGEPDAGLRLYWTGSTLVATAAGIPPELDQLRVRGLRLVSLPLGVALERPAWLLAGVKSTSYATNMAAEAEARRRGADDALFVAEGGIVLEAPISNVWWRHGDVLHTASLELGVLAGVTRATVLELAPAAGYRVEEGSYPLEHVLAADEAFTSSSIRELLPVVDLDGTPIGDGRPGAAVASLQQAL